jgi:murein DD-endopeptidase MepM/ murein hydrolase activator NlpD
MRLRTKELANELGASFGKVRNWNSSAKKYEKFHQGWDLEAPTGTECYAIGDGVVVAVGTHPQFGNYVNLQITNAETVAKKSPNSSQPTDLFAFYAHLSQALVSVGQSVRAGDRVGLTGYSGNAQATAPHLHFEIRNTAATSPGLGNTGRIDPAEVLGHGHLRCR